MILMKIYKFQADHDSTHFLSQLKASLVYIESSRPARTIQYELPQKKKKKKKTNNTRSKNLTVVMLIRLHACPITSICLYIYGYFSAVIAELKLSICFCWSLLPEEHKLCKTLIMIIIISDFAGSQEKWGLWRNTQFINYRCLYYWPINLLLMKRTSRHLWK